MFLWIILTLGVVFTEGRFFPSRGQFRNPLQGTGESKFTRIAVEFISGNVEDVFIKGGFTNGDPDRCSGADASSDPCSIPIKHQIPDNASDSYRNWANNDNFLDFQGREAGQGQHRGQSALGTPMDQISTQLAIRLTNSEHHQTIHRNSIFWYAELEMDCSDTDGYFEIEVVSNNGDNSRRNPTRKMKDPNRAPIRLNFPKNFDFSKLPTISREDLMKSIRKPPPGFNITARPESDSRGEDDFSLDEAKPPKAYGWKANMDTATGPDAKPFPITPKKKAPASRRDDRFNMNTCHGTASFHAPYEPVSGRYIGRCGYANIFRIDTIYCETNHIPNTQN